MCICVYELSCHGVLVEVREQLGILFYHMDPRDQIQVLRLGTHALPSGPARASLSLIFLLFSLVTGGRLASVSSLWCAPVLPGTMARRRKLQTWGEILHPKRIHLKNAAFFSLEKILS